MVKDNYYEILGVTQTASSDEIKRAYYALSKKYHPDINPKTANLFRNITDAYNVLKDPLSRKKYDELLELGLDSNNIEDTDIFDTTFTDDYYTNPEYYQDPFKEPLANILDNFWKFRFENVMAAVWKRNIFVLIANFFLYFSIFIGILINRIVRLFNNKGISLNLPENIWTTYIIEAIEENKLWRYICWSSFMFSIASCKLIYHTFNIIYWIFAKIIKYFLIPAAIIIASLLHVNKARL